MDTPVIPRVHAFGMRQCIHVVQRPRQQAPYTGKKNTPRTSWKTATNLSKVNKLTAVYFQHSLAKAPLALNFSMIRHLDISYAVYTLPLDEWMTQSNTKSVGRPITSLTEFHWWYLQVWRWSISWNNRDRLPETRKYYWKSEDVGLWLLRSVTWAVRITCTERICGVYSCDWRMSLFHNFETGRPLCSQPQSGFIL